MNIESPIENIKDPTWMEKIRYPGSWWNNSVHEERKKKKKEIKESVRGKEFVFISDSDTDGLTCLAISDVAFNSSKTALIDTGKSSLVDLEETLSIVNEHSKINSDIYVSDIPIDKRDLPGIMRELGKKKRGRVTIYDHHEWDHSVKKKVGKVANVDLRTDGVCASDIVYDSLKLQIPRDEREKYEELVEVTRDQDLWIKEDPRSNDLRDLQFYYDKETYIEKVKEYGPDVIKDDEIRQDLREKRKEKIGRIETEVKLSDWYQIVRTKNGNVEAFRPRDLRDIPEDKIEDSMTIAMPYGSAYHSAVGSILCRGWEHWNEKVNPLDDVEGGSFVENVTYAYDYFRPGDADLAAIIFPRNKVSFRSTDENPVCDKIAQSFNSGGHDKAASCKPNVIGKSEEDYQEHWDTMGEKTKNKILDRLIEMYKNGELDDH